MRRTDAPLIILALVLLFTTAVATENDYKSVILMDAASGEILFAENEHEPLPPASMVKMMTELIVLEHVVTGEISFDDQVEVSARASVMGGSQVYLKDGEVFSVHDLLQALAIHSANDAAVSLAEHLAGSVEAFIELMNSRAKELGMNDSDFHFVHGLPPAYGQNSDLSSAYDMALLGRQLAIHPEALEWAVMDQIPFRNGEFLLTNPNPLVGKYRGLEGIKTGFHSQAGFCLTASAMQKGIRLISVVMGASTNKARGRETTRLLTRGFNMYTRLTLVAAANDPLPDLATVKAGEIREVGLVYGSELIVGVRKEQSDRVRLEHRVPNKLEAPLKAGDVVGTAVAVVDGKNLGEVSVLVAESVARGSFLQRLMNR